TPATPEAELPLAPEAPEPESEISPEAQQLETEAQEVVDANIAALHPAAEPALEVVPEPEDGFHEGLGKGVEELDSHEAVDEMLRARYPNGVPSQYREGLTAIKDFMNPDFVPTQY